MTIWDPQLRERIKRRGAHDCFDDVDLAFVDALDEIEQLRAALTEALDGWDADRDIEGGEPCDRSLELRRLVTP